jgi:hypothetical protein
MSTQRAQPSCIRAGAWLSCPVLCMLQQDSWGRGDDCPPPQSGTGCHVLAMHSRSSKRSTSWHHQHTRGQPGHLGAAAGIRLPFSGWLAGEQAAPCPARCPVWLGMSRVALLAPTSCCGSTSGSPQQEQRLAQPSSQSSLVGAAVAAGMGGRPAGRNGCTAGREPMHTAGNQARVC